MVQLLGKTLQQFLTKSILHIPYYSANSFLGIYPREKKTCTQKDLEYECLLTLSIIAQNEKHKCPSISEWISKE